MTINLLHITPWSTCAALMRSAARTLPAGGLRDLSGVKRTAADAGLTWVEDIAMPANNVSVVFGKP